MKRTRRSGKAKRIIKWIRDNQAPTVSSRPLCAREDGLSRLINHPGNYHGVLITDVKVGTGGFVTPPDDC